MAEILSQKEIDDLIAAMVAEETGRSPQKAQPQVVSIGHRRVRVYDFRRPDKFSKDQLRTLHMIHDNFSRLLTTFFSGQFRTMVQMVVGSVDQATYQEFVRSVTNPTVLGVFSLPPLKGNCVIDINPAISFPMLDRLFGGPGQALQQNRPLTEIEQVVMSRVVNGTLDALKEAWKNIIGFTPRLERLETSPLFAQIVAPNEIVVTVAIDVRVGEHVGAITLCLPFIVLEPILEKISAHNWFSSATSEVDPVDTEILRQRVGEARVQLVAQLGSAEVTVGELLDLEPGDVVVLDQKTNQELLMFVGTRPKFTILPGVRNGRMAARIRGLVEEGEETDE